MVWAGEDDTEPEWETWAVVPHLPRVGWVTWASPCHPEEGWLWKLREPLQFRHPLRAGEARAFHNRSGSALSARSTQASACPGP